MWEVHGSTAGMLNVFVYGRPRLNSESAAEKFVAGEFTGVSDSVFKGRIISMMFVKTRLHTPLLLLISLNNPNLTGTQLDMSCIMAFGSKNKMTFISCGQTYFEDAKCIAQNKRW